MRKMMVTVFALAAFVNGGAEDMPTLNWMGRKDAERATKDVVMKILREDKSLSYAGGTRSVASDCQTGFSGLTGLVDGGSATLTQRTQRTQRNAKPKESAPTLFDSVDADVSSASANGRATSMTSPQPTTDNILVHGDNLEALHALLPFYAGRVKCIYIDPPYNTGSAFEHYDDNLEHSTWLSMMYPRLKLLRDFMSEDGSIWITLDDEESHYCKVICDEIFGRGNFLVDIVWQHSVQPKGYLDKFSIHHNHILLYRKSGSFNLNPLEREDKDNKAYSNPDNDPKGLWRSGDVRNALYRPNLIYDVLSPSGKVIKPCKNGWRWSKETMDEKIRTGEIIFSKDESRIIHKIYLANVRGRAPESIFFGEFVGTTREAMAEIKTLFGSPVFETPKPERLIQRILTIATNPGDLVLDSFLGSGTTAAVAQKMNRRWIGIEMGEHAKTHCAVRLKKVIDGEQGGISKAVGWKGGGGFRYYELGEPIIDENGAITESIPYEALAAHVWWSETGCGWCATGAKSTVLGIHKGVAYALLYNGILHDRSVTGGNVLTPKTLKIIQEDLGREKWERLVIYGECTKIGAAKLKELKIEFRQTPYDIVAGR